VTPASSSNPSAGSPDKKKDFPNFLKTSLVSFGRSIKGEKHQQLNEDQLGAVKKVNSMPIMQDPIAHAPSNNVANQNDSNFSYTSSKDDFELPSSSSADDAFTDPIPRNKRLTGTIDHRSTMAFLNIS